MSHDLFVRDTPLKAFHLFFWTLPFEHDRICKLKKILISPAMDRIFDKPPYKDLPRS